jgi:hypothetical protein
MGFLLIVPQAFWRFVALATTLSDEPLLTTNLIPLTFHLREARTWVSMFSTWTPVAPAR